MSIYRGSQKIKEMRFGGSQKIKEAYVGGQLVYKGGWDASPMDGVMFTETGAFVSYTNIIYNSTSKTWRIDSKKTGVVTGIVFGMNTTAFTFVTKIVYQGFEILIDGESVGTYSTTGENIVPIPSKFINDQAHTISIKNKSSNPQIFSAMNFNV